MQGCYRAWKTWKIPELSYMAWKTWKSNKTFKKKPGKRHLYDLELFQQNKMLNLNLIYSSSNSIWVLIYYFDIKV